MARLQALWARLWTFSLKGIPEHPKARLAFLTIPAPGVMILNLQFEGEFMRVQVNREQLGGIVVAGARELLMTGGGR